MHIKGYTKFNIGDLVCLSKSGTNPSASVTDNYYGVEGETTSPFYDLRHAVYGDELFRPLGCLLDLLVFISTISSLFCHFAYMDQSS